MKLRRQGATGPKVSIVGVGHNELLISILLFPSTLIPMDFIEGNLALNLFTFPEVLDYPLNVPI